MRKKLTLHDLRLKIDRMKADKQKKRSSSQQRGGESQNVRRWPPFIKRANTPVRPLHNQKAPPSGKKVGDMNIEELKRLMEKMDAEKGTVNPMGTFSPFT